MKRKLTATSNNSTVQQVYVPPALTISNSASSIQGFRMIHSEKMSYFLKKN